MNEMEKSDNDIEQIKKIFEIGNYVLKNKIYLFLFILYTVSFLILLYLILLSTQEIINSKLINIFINLYINDKLIALTTFLGLIGALTILIGYISSENEEKIIDKEGKLIWIWNPSLIKKLEKRNLVIK